jgi:hypothetical protein
MSTTTAANSSSALKMVFDGIQYAAQCLLDRIDERTNASPSTRVLVWETVPAWTECSAAKVTIRFFLRNPCQTQGTIKLRKSDHPMVRRSLAYWENIVKFESFQYNGRGSWHIRLTKRIRKTVLATSVKCDCPTMARNYYNYNGNSALCMQSNGAKLQTQTAKDQTTLQTLVQILPVKMRPLQATNASNAASGGVECLGEENAVDAAFKRAEDAGEIIEID